MNMIACVNFNAIVSKLLKVYKYQTQFIFSFHERLFITFLINMKEFMKDNCARSRQILGARLRNKPFSHSINFFYIRLVVDKRLESPKKTKQDKHKQTIERKIFLKFKVLYMHFS